MEILEEFRRERTDELATIIQKLWRGYYTRQKWTKLHKSQVVISSCWKQWKDKTHIDEMKQRRIEDSAAFVIQKALKMWQVIFLILSAGIQNLCVVKYCLMKGMKKCFKCTYLLISRNLIKQNLQLNVFYFSDEDTYCV